MNYDQLLTSGTQKLEDLILSSNGFVEPLREIQQGLELGIGGEQPTHAQVIAAGLILNEIGELAEKFEEMVILVGRLRKSTASVYFETENPVAA